MPPKVLVVDDLADNVKLVALTLEDAGYQVLTASNGREALRVILEEGPPIVVTDWMMPEMDGIELCRRIRELEGIGFVYVILLTAHNDMERLVEAFKAGADDFLSKPFHEAELLVRLDAGTRVVRLESDLAAQRLSMHKVNAQLASLNGRLETLASTDELTGMLNRREAMRYGEEQWALSCRSNQPLACVMFDVDHFKKVNDTYGHDAGDKVLREIASRVEKVRRTGEQAYRIGGEEFLILCPSATGQQAVQGAERLRASIANEAISLGDFTINVTVSLGVAERTAETETPATMLRHADEALYEAKRGGRNRVALASPFFHDADLMQPDVCSE